MDHHPQSISQERQILLPNLHCNCSVPSSGQGLREAEKSPSCCEPLESLEEFLISLELVFPALVFSHEASDFLVASWCIRLGNTRSRLSNCLFCLGCLCEYLRLGRVVKGRSCVDLDLEVDEAQVTDLK